MGGWWRLDEVIEPSLQLVCDRAQGVVPVAPTPIEVEAYDIDHETSDQVSTILPLNSFERNFSSRKDPILETIHIAFGSELGGIPNCFGCPMKMHFIRFGFELINLKLFHISVAAPNF